MSSQSGLLMWGGTNLFRLIFGADLLLKFETANYHVEKKSSY